MTKNELIHSFELFGISLPNNGESDFLNLRNINHITVSKRETLFPKYGDMRIKINTKKEIMKVYRLDRNNNFKKDNYGEEYLDVYDFSAIKLIAGYFGKVE